MYLPYLTALTPQLRDWQWTQTLLLVMCDYDNRLLTFKQQTPHVRGYRHFPPSGRNRNLKLTFSKSNLNLISTWSCGSVVPDCLWATYRFPAVLCSRVSFRLSVRQATSRVIMRNSTNNLQCKMPYLGARTCHRYRR